MKNILLSSARDIIDRSSLERRLRSKKKLRVKFGVDPSSPDLHLGHYVILKQLDTFARFGHKVIFLVGDFTAQIGDPSGRKTERPVLSPEQVKKNVKTYIDQVSLVLDTTKIEIRYNSEWYKKMVLAEWLEIMAKFSANYIFERDDFSKRIKSGLSLGMHETMYPIMQAYDSIVLKADVELGGADQRFNILAGRSLQKKMGVEPQDVITFDLLVGTDGKRKMSKSLGNYIGFTDTPEDMFGKIMSIPDELTAMYADLILNKKVSALKKAIGSGHPMEVKKQLALEIVSIFHKGNEEVARAHFERIFSARELPAAKPFSCKCTTVLQAILFVEKEQSSSNVRRLAQQGGIKVNGKPISLGELNCAIAKGDIISIGRRKSYILK